jgi:hypothetical protein
MDDTQPMTVSYQNTDAELCDIYRYALGADPAGRRAAVDRVVWLHVLAVLAALALGHVHWGLAGLFFVILEIPILLRRGLLGGRGFSKTVRSWVERTHKDAWRKDWLSPTVLSLSSEGLAYRKWYSACSYSWVFLDAVTIWGQYVVIATGSSALAMIPRRAFASDADMQNFAAAAQSMMQRAKAEQPPAPAGQPPPAAPERTTADDQAD